MKTLTYGVLPKYSEFRDAFMREVGVTPNGERPQGTYSVRHGSPTPAWEIPSGDYTCRELYVECKRLTALEKSGEVETEDMREGRAESPGGSVSAILYTLGFEWV